MAICETNIIQVSECDDIYVSAVTYNTGTEILTVTLSDGNFYTATIPSSAVEISATGDNQLTLLGDGLYVPLPTFAVDSLAYEAGDNLVVTSGDSSIDITTSKVGTEITIDLSVAEESNNHPALAVTPNAAYSFNASTQVLSIPLPTLELTDTNEYTYTANNGSGNVYVLTLHEPLDITTGAPYSFDAATQSLELPLPSITNNLDGTFTVNNGDGTATFDIETVVDVCAELNSCTLADFGDVNIAGLISGQVLVWNGAAWIPGDAADAVVSTVTDNLDGTYTHDNGDGISVVIETATKVDQPFTTEGGSQIERETPLTLIDDIYHTGNVGIGTIQSDSLLGKLHVKNGTQILQNAGTQALFRILFSDKEFNVSGEKLTSIQEFTINTVLRRVLNVDDSGNLGVSTLPEDKYSAANTFTLSDITGESSAPNCPIDSISVTGFVMVI